MAKAKKTAASKSHPADRFRNASDVELKNMEKDFGDQLFRLKFQMKLGQTESVTKMRQLKKDVARLKTVKRERQLAGAGEAK